MNNPQLGLHFHFYTLIYEVSMIRCGHLAASSWDSSTQKVRPGQTSPHTFTHDASTAVQFDMQDSRLELSGTSEMFNYFTSTGYKWLNCHLGDISCLDKDVLKSFLDLSKYC